MAAPAAEPIRIRGARQHNLQGIDLDIPTGRLVVVTGVSGSGKSSLVFDTLYAEGQRRYVETFSPYARQFLDRMDRPAVDRIDGVPPAIAIDQTNPVRSSRSTVGTMTEINDHLKLLFARTAILHCRNCQRRVERDTPATILASLRARAATPSERIVVTFPVRVPANFTPAEVLTHLQAQGYHQVHAQGVRGDALVLDVVRDRVRLDDEEPRLLEAIEEAMRLGGGRVDVWPAFAPENPGATAGGPAGAGPPLRFSSGLHCAHCDIAYAEPLPSTFSFNSPVGACEKCRGFGRVIGIDHALVIPDPRKSLREGAIKPWQTASFRECQQDLERLAPKGGIDLDRAWESLDERSRSWVLDGDPAWKGDWKRQWYGVDRFFEWLESRAYKMHIRVLLSRYRSYTTCPQCAGTRLKPEALLWRIGEGAGRTIHDLQLLPVEDLRAALAQARPGGGAEGAATRMLVDEVESRLHFLCEVGLGYLTLDRQSRTLSGGEVQRINLTTALGTSLVNTLFVLDEPSIGLHPRDMERVIGVLHRLRDAGNSLVVVEHDPQIMRAADRMIDMGPGPGERGGRVVFEGSPAALAAGATLTGEYLGGRRLVDAAAGPRAPVLPSTPRIVLEGAREHNLRGIDAAFPLHRLVVVTGVSGSGKSTLVQDVLYPALRRAKGRPDGEPGAHDRCLGADWVEEVSLVDQSPIGRTTRSNPASVVGAFDPVRKLFAREPAAAERGYGPGTFSFNGGDGRCPTCGGNGFEHVEMQFLADVYLRCPDCDGRRYRPEILEVKISRAGRLLSIADVLDCTASEALALFAGEGEIERALAPLVDVGLEYLRLGQPVTTLSGGEAQRLKIAGFLAEAARGEAARTRRGGDGARGSLLLFDEPTTGLHFEDISRLLRALRKLIAAGHSLIVIEHNLDVIRAADWILDLGPEGGAGGGALVVAGEPDAVAAHPSSHTGRALREYEAALAASRAAGTGVAAHEAAAPYARSAPPSPNIEILRAREHNLRDIDVSIPRGAFTVITGVSGSGKSTLAFDILFQEGQRRYLESLNAYARSMVQPAARPDVDAIHGIAPTVAIEQRVSRGGRKSTVATQTELHHFLRLLYVQLGVQHCPDCGIPVQPLSFDSILATVLREFRGEEIGVLAPLIVNRKGVYTDLARWASDRGHTHLRLDGRFVPTRPWQRPDRFREHSIDLPVGSLRVDPNEEAALRTVLQSAIEHGKGTLEIVWPLSALRAALAGDDGGPAPGLQRRVFSSRRSCTGCGRAFPEPDPRMFSYNSHHGWCTTCFGTGLQLPGFEPENSGEEAWFNEWLEGEAQACPACHGRRLNPVSLAVQFQGCSIAELGAMSVEQAHRWVGDLRLDGRSARIARDILSEVGSRLGFLREVGLGYLGLDRSAPTLSGGEAQRIRLAAQLGSNLQGVCYVLDEPTIGLHARDNAILLSALARLGERGNTLVVVEHDEDTIRAAGHLIDIGPGAGTRGGRVVAQGSVDALLAAPDSMTGAELRQERRIAPHPRRAVGPGDARIRIVGADLHNLRGIDVELPLGRLIAVTGVSGSGKSTLARDVLLANLQEAQAARREGRSAERRWSGCARIEGWEALARVLEVDQSPIGKTPRSCAATYVGIWDAIRRRFAEATEARVRGYGPGRFSFNTAGGRCPVCEGQGLRTLEMSFLPDVKVVCESCGGARFDRSTLEVTWRGKSIGDVLRMEIDEAAEFFGATDSIAHSLRLLCDVGLGYLTLGQASPTLSGGEAQRIKLVTELSRARDAQSASLRRGAPFAPTLYVLDEPSVGLSMYDVRMLLAVIHRLVDAGHTVVVVEHNLDMVAEADWVIDLGPDGGADGGLVVAAGPPQDVVGGGGATARALRSWGGRGARALAESRVS